MLTLPSVLPTMEADAVCPCALTSWLCSRVPMVTPKPDPITPLVVSFRKLFLVLLSTAATMLTLLPAAIAVPAVDTTLLPLTLMSLPARTATVLPEKVVPWLTASLLLSSVLTVREASMPPLSVFLCWSRALAVLTSVPMLTLLPAVAASEPSALT